jgi:hypothetical protein
MLRLIWRDYFKALGRGKGEERISFSTKIQLQNVVLAVLALDLDTNLKINELPVR